jgi:hypothetical protein
MVKSYRTLMAATRAVLRDTATIVRRLCHRMGAAILQVQPRLQRAHDQLQAMRPLVQRVFDQTLAVTFQCPIRRVPTSRTTKTYRVRLALCSPLVAGEERRNPFGEMR